MKGRTISTGPHPTIRHRPDGRHRPLGTPPPQAATHVFVCWELMTTSKGRANAQCPPGVASTPAGEPDRARRGRPRLSVPGRTTGSPPVSTSTPGPRAYLCRTGSAPGLSGKDLTGRPIISTRELPGLSGGMSQDLVDELNRQGPTVSARGGLCGAGRDIGGVSSVAELPTTVADSEISR